MDALRRARRDDQCLRDKKNSKSGCRFGMVTLSLQTIPLAKPSAFSSNVPSLSFTSVEVNSLNEDWAFELGENHSSPCNFL